MTHPIVVLRFLKLGGASEATYAPASGFTGTVPGFDEWTELELLQAGRRIGAVRVDLVQTADIAVGQISIRLGIPFFPPTVDNGNPAPDNDKRLEIALVLRAAKPDAWEIQWVLDIAPGQPTLLGNLFRYEDYGWMNFGDLKPIGAIGGFVWRR